MDTWTSRSTGRSRAMGRNPTVFFVILLLGFHGLEAELF